VFLRPLGQTGTASFLRAWKAEETKVKKPLQLLERYLTSYRPAKVEGLPRFFGGAVGYIGYETVSFFEAIPDQLPDKLGVPDTWFMVPKVVLIFDNLKQTIKVVFNVHLSEGAEPGAYYDNAAERIVDIVDRLTQCTSIGTRPRQESSPSRIESKISREEFESMVSKAKDYIRQGEIIQVVLSQTRRPIFSICNSTGLLCLALLLR